MDKRKLPTEADYVTLAFNPLLVTAMVTSLVWFLLELLYRGDYDARLHWSMTMFVVIIVGTAQIAMQEGWERASIYGPIGAVAVWLAMQEFVAVPGPDGAAHSSGWINALIMAVIWVTGHMLTWDSTWIDERAELPDEGLLQAAGMEPASGREVPAKAASGWWFARWLHRMRRPHAPGLWVVYYSLGALPIFGLGQLFLPPNQPGKRYYAFILCTVYVLAALGLLVGTSFLGLRRFLRQRGMQMPLAMTGIWLATGGAMIAAVVLLAMALPRPNAEYALAQLPFQFDSPRGNSPSRHAVGGEGTKPSDEVPDAATTADTPQAAQPASSSSPEGSGEPSGKPGGASEGQKDSPSQSSAAADSGNEQPALANESNDSPSAANSGDARAGGQTPNSHAEQPAAEQAGGRDSPPNADAPPPAKEEEVDRQIRALRERQQPVEEVQRLVNELQQSTPVGVVAWLFGLLWPLVIWGWYLALVVAFVLFVYYNSARLRDYFNNLWQRWLAGWRNFWGTLRDGDEEGQAAPRRRRERFRHYDDPFISGKGAQASLAELVRYSYEALEAWAADAGLARHAKETPHEFARRLGEAVPILAAPARNVADLFSRVHYGGRTLPAGARDELELLWQQMTAQPPGQLFAAAAEVP